MATVRRAVAFGAACLALTTTWSAAAEARSAGAPTAVRSVWTLTTPGGGSMTSSSGSAPGAVAGPLVQVHRRALVTFRVAQPVTPPPLTFSLPAGAGRYAAYFFPETREGLAALRDPASSEHWPAVVMFGAALGLPTLYPHHRYQLAVATDRPAAVRMPVPMRILSVRQTSFPVRVMIHPVQPAVDPAPAFTVSLPTGQGQGGFNAAAVALDWNDDRDLIGAGGGSACLSRRSTPDCSDSASNAGYFEHTSSGGPGARPAQSVYGVGYDRPIFAPYLDADGWHAPTGFDAATVFGFGMTVSTTSP